MVLSLVPGCKVVGHGRWMCSLSVRARWRTVTVWAGLSRSQVAEPFGTGSGRSPRSCNPGGRGRSRRSGSSCRAGSVGVGLINGFPTADIRPAGIALAAPGSNPSNNIRTSGWHRQGPFWYGFPGWLNWNSRAHRSQHRSRGGHPRWRHKVGRSASHGTDRGALWWPFPCRLAFALDPKEALQGILQRARPRFPRPGSKVFPPAVPAVVVLLVGVYDAFWPGGGGSSSRGPRSDIRPGSIHGKLNLLF